MADNNFIPDLVIRGARIGTGKGRNFSGQKRVVNGQVMNSEGNSVALENGTLTVELKANFEAVAVHVK